MKDKTCCFTGHRNIPEHKKEAIKEALKVEIVKLINQGVCFFGAGGALGFDTLAAQTVIELKEQYPHIKLILVFPCYNQTIRWKEQDVKVYEDIKSKCDKFIYTSSEYDGQCMMKRNRHLVDNSKYCVCYLTKTTGGSVYTVNYAKTNNLTIINIANKL